MKNAASKVYEGADVMDSRDVIERIEELEAEKEAEDFPEDDAEELAKLLKLRDEAEGSPDWEYGETLVADSYFKEYAEQLAEDIGAVNQDATWPNNFIDWDAAAEALKQDYMSVTFGETEYWIRA